MSKLLRNAFIFLATVVTSMIFGVTANAEEIVIDNAISSTVANGTVYWENSDQWGSDNHNTVCRENPYTDVIQDEFPVWVDGYCVIDRNGNTIESFFDEKSLKLIISTTASKQNIMLHIWGADEGGYRLGWVKFNAVFNENKTSDYSISEVPEGNEDDWFDDLIKDKTIDQTAGTLINELKKDATIPRKSYILADFSGSMYSFQSDVLKKLVNINGKKYVFANDIAEFDPKKDSHGIGTGTDIPYALNNIPIDSTSHIYLLSDLEDNYLSEIKGDANFIGEVTIIYYPGLYRWLARDLVEKIRKAYPNATINGF